MLVTENNLDKEYPIYYNVSPDSTIRYYRATAPVHGQGHIGFAICCLDAMVFYFALLSIYYSVLVITTMAFEFNSL